MKFELLKPIQGSTACLTCGCGSHDTLSMERLLAVGFGSCIATRDGEEVYSEPMEPKSDDDYWTAAKVEELAAKDPDHDWRIEFYAPLYDATYQRQGDGHWPLVKKGMGFA